MGDNLSCLIYSPLMEESQPVTGWSKATIEFVTNNKTKILNSIRGIGKSLNKQFLQKADIDDIYMEILQYLYTCDDYNVEKAFERSNNAGVVVSLEGYVHSCVKYCVLRYLTDKYKKEKPLISDYVKGREELSIFDTIPDKNKPDINSQTDLREICENIKSKRYAYGVDVYQIWFIRLKTMSINKNDKYQEILDVLNISTKDVSFVEKSDTEGIMMSIAKAVTLIGVDMSLDIIRKYVYSAKNIEKVIEAF